MKVKTANRGIPQALPCGEYESRSANDSEIRYKAYKEKEYLRNNG